MTRQMPPVSPDPVSPDYATAIIWSKNPAAQSLLQERITAEVRVPLRCILCEKVASGLFAAGRWFEERAQWQAEPTAA